MQKAFRKIYVLWIVALLFFLLIFYNFQNNIFGFVKDQDNFRKFEDFSEALIVGKIVADKHEIDTRPANLGFISVGKLDRRWIATEGYQILEDDSIPTDKLQFRPYGSQYGLQGRIYSALYRQLGFKLEHFEIINSLLLTIVFCALYFCYSKLFDKAYAFVFLITSISSPWVVIFARNFYWIPFTWYLPTLFAALACLADRKLIFYLLIFFSFFIKSLAGYEYLSSITLLACSLPLIEPFFKKREVNWWHQLKSSVVIFLLCVAGFLVAVLVHAASLDNSNIGAGIQVILSTAAKRTVGSEALLLNPRGQAAIDASPLSVIAQYITQWDTPIFLGLPGEWFSILFRLALVSLFLKLIFRHPNRNKHWALFLGSFLVPTSWFVLAKTHSYFHTHLNYVLWYLSFLPAMIYVLSDDVVTLARYSFKKIQRFALK